MSTTDKPVVLWIDLRNSDRSSSLLDLFERRFQIHCVNAHDPRFDHKVLDPCAICFDFDHPDIHGLTLLREIHERHPMLPMIMMTEQHSEAMMVWALRARVWEIILKPLSRSSAEYQINTLYEALSAMRQQPQLLFDSSPMLRMPEEARYHGSNAEGRALHPAISYMQLHLGERIAEEQLAQFCNMRPLQFSRQFKKAYGVTFQEFLQQLRIREATRLLENPERQILEVALTVGFRDHSYFCRVFRKYLGVTPKTYQEQRLSQEAEATTEQAKLYAVANLHPASEARRRPE